MKTPTKLYAKLGTKPESTTYIHSIGLLESAKQILDSIKDGMK